jgi:hypothetical protein
MKATFHRNLNATNGNAWSFVFQGKATQAKTIYACNVSVKQPSGKKFDAVIAGTGNRSVFAWFKSGNVSPNDSTPVSPGAVRIRFNPKLGQTCFQTDDGTRVDFMFQVWCLENGECYATI